MSQSELATKPYRVNNLDSSKVVPRWMKASIDQLQPGHVAAGLGGANRQFLSVCLGVFDDAKLLKRLEDQFRKAVSKVAEWTPIPDLTLARESVAESARRWELDETLSDSQLRAILWIRLQRALAVDPSITRSVRGCERLVDDLVASGLRDLNHEARRNAVGRVVERVRERGAMLWRRKQDVTGSLEAVAPEDLVPHTLAALVEPLLSEMVRRALGEGVGAMDEEDKHRLVVEIVGALGEEERFTRSYGKR